MDWLRNHAFLSEWLSVVLAIPALAIQFHKHWRKPGTLSSMSVNDIISSIDSDISRLQQARALLIGERGRKITAAPSAKPKRTMSAAGRKRIADAQRKRWAAQKKAAKY